VRVIKKYLNQLGVITKLSLQICQGAAGGGTEGDGAAVGGSHGRGAAGAAGSACHLASVLLLTAMHSIPLLG